MKTKKKKSNEVGFVWILKVESHFTQLVFDSFRHAHKYMKNSMCKPTTKVTTLFDSKLDKFYLLLDQGEGFIDARMVSIYCETILCNYKD
jgi:hypothetical protein